METLFIKATDETPEVLLDCKKNIFIFCGRSLPEDVTTFYTPILNWLDTYISNPNPETIVDFKLDYFNTASSKIILDILMKLEEIHLDDKKLCIKWYFKDKDFDMKEAGEEYADLVDVPFEYIML